VRPPSRLATRCASACGLADALFDLYLDDHGQLGQQAYGKQTSALPLVVDSSTAVGFTQVTIGSTFACALTASSTSSYNSELSCQLRRVHF
jgi:hypothetical protein